MPHAWNDNNNPLVRLLPPVILLQQILGVSCAIGNVSGTDWSVTSACAMPPWHGNLHPTLVDCWSYPPWIDGVAVRLNLVAPWQRLLFIVQFKPSLLPATTTTHSSAPPSSDSSATHHERPMARTFDTTSIKEDSSSADSISSNRVLELWSGPARTLATFTRIGLFGRRWLAEFVINPVTVLYNVVDQPGPLVSAATTSTDTRYTSTAYATNQGHWLRGEERVPVVYRGGGSSGQVNVEIVSYSQAGPGMGKNCLAVCGSNATTILFGRTESHETCGKARRRDDSDNRCCASPGIAPLRFPTLEQVRCYFLISASLIRWRWSDTECGSVQG